MASLRATTALGHSFCDYARLENLFAPQAQAKRIGFCFKSPAGWELIRSQMDDVVLAWRLLPQPKMSLLHLNDPQKISLPQFTASVRAEISFRSSYVHTSINQSSMLQLSMTMISRSRIDSLARVNV